MRGGNTPVLQRFTRQKNEPFPWSHRTARARRFDTCGFAVLALVGDGIELVLDGRAGDHRRAVVAVRQVEGHGIPRAAALAVGLDE